MSYECRSQWLSLLLLLLLGSLLLLGGALGLSGLFNNLLGSLGNRGVKGLLAMSLNGADAAIFDTLAEEGAGDGADDLELFDKGRGGDVLAELRDTSDDAVIGGTIDEHCVISFLFNFSLGPFLE